jgi:hypothetical protein
MFESAMMQNGVEIEALKAGKGICMKRRAGCSCCQALFCDLLAMHNVPCTALCDCLLKNNAMYLTCTPPKPAYIASKLIYIASMLICNDTM